MALINPLRGEATFSAQGQSFTLVIDADILVRLEEHVGQELFVFYPKLMTRPTFKLLAAALWAGLQTEHPDITESEARTLVLASGAEGAVALRAAFARMMPTPDESGEAAGPPPKAEAAGGTGSASSATGASSDAAVKRISGRRRRVR